MRKSLLEVGQRLGGLFLRDIGLDRAGGNEGPIMGAERGGGGRQHGSPYGLNRKKNASRELVQRLCA